MAATVPPVLACAAHKLGYAAWLAGSTCTANTDEPRSQGGPEKLDGDKRMVSSLSELQLDDVRDALAGRTEFCAGAFIAVVQGNGAIGKRTPYQRRSMRGL